MVKRVSGFVLVLALVAWAFIFGWEFGAYRTRCEARDLGLGHFEGSIRDIHFIWHRTRPMSFARAKSELAIAKFRLEQAEEKYEALEARSTVIPAASLRDARYEMLIERERVKIAEHILRESADE